MLQQDRQLKVIAHALEKKIKKELEEMLEKERETYEKFWKAFGLQLKFALYSSFGAERDKLQDLLLFTRASDSKLCTLKEYRDAMPESQKYITTLPARARKNLRCCRRRKPSATKAMIFCI